jgi:hypothetical protein
MCRLRFQIRTRTLIPRIERRQQTIAGLSMRQLLNHSVDVRAEKAIAL